MTEHPVCLRRKPRAWEPATLAQEVQHRFLDALLQAGTLAEACERTGVSRGAALATRARNAMFALQWDRVNDMRLAEIESLLLEKTVQGLAGGDTGAAQEKFIASLGQWFLEARISARYGKGSGKGGSAKEAARETDRGDEAARKDAPPAARKVADLLARTAARLADAEQRLGGE